MLLIFFCRWFTTCNVLTQTPCDVSMLNLVAPMMSQRSIIWGKCYYWIQLQRGYFGAYVCVCVCVCLCVFVCVCLIKMFVANHFDNSKCDLDSLISLDLGICHPLFCDTKSEKTNTEKYSRQEHPSGVLFSFFILGFLDMMFFTMPLRYSVGELTRPFLVL